MRMSRFVRSVMYALPAASVLTPMGVLKRTVRAYTPLLAPVPSRYPASTVELMKQRDDVHPSSVLTTPVGVIIRSLLLPESTT